jgi:NAD(P)-dependent dehydrogenase (short-subunit alcohol dehydrogenase family)
MGALDGQVAIMTGGGTGIGRAAALMMAAEGAQVVVAGRRKPPLDEVAGEIARAGGRAVAHACDVAKPAEGRALAEWTIAQYGRVDVLVNNAGHSSKRRNVRWVEQADWDAVIAVNLTGVYALTQAVLPSMIERGGGTIVTISSLAALKPGLIGGAPYGAAKAGVLNLMGHVHTVLREKGIRATTIMPAEVDTPILDNRPLVPDDRARATMMQAEDVARAIMLCVTLPPRTVVETMVISPTILRDQSADIRVARDLGATPGAR